MLIPSISDKSYEGNHNLPDTSSIGAVLARISKAKRSGNGWIASCPAHDDENPSLSVKLNEMGNVLLHCHAGCEFDDVIKSLRLAKQDLFPSTGKQGRLVAIYDYADEQNQLLYQVVRYDKPKTFRQRQLLPSGKVEWDVKGIQRVLYHLSEVRAAISYKKTIYIVEGEKDADQLWSRGLPATTNAMGAGKWLPEYSQSLKGADVVILPDNDAAGEKHATTVANALHGVAATIRVVNLPDLAPAGDVSDWLRAGGTAQQLSELASQTPEWQVSKSPEYDDKAFFGLLTEEEADNLPPPTWLLRDYIIAGETTLLYGRRGSGKTTIATDFAMQVAKEHKVLWCVGEDAPGLKLRRQAWRLYHNQPRFTPVTNFISRRMVTRS
jgi:putative DNA primase/helicase